MGAPIDTNANEGVSFYDAQEASLSAGAFLSDLAVGSVVRITGAWENAQLLYETMAIIR